MKKFIYTLIALIAIASPALADKAKIKLGPAKLVAKDAIAAVVQGNFINLTMGGVKGQNSGTLTLLIPADETFEKGSTIEVFSLVGETDDDNPGEIALGFTATKIKVKGLSVSSTSYAEAAETVTTGKLKVKSYNPDTKVLKFNLSAQASPYTQNKGDGNNTISKNFKIKAQASVTLP